MRYDEVITLLEGQLSRKSDDITILGKMADTYLRWGKTDSAHVYFSKILAQAPDSPFHYTYISNLLIQNRMFAEAIELLHNAREKLQRDDLFSYELARLYSWYKKYKESYSIYIPFI